MCGTYVLLVAHVKYFNGNGVKVKQEFVAYTKKLRGSAFVDAVHSYAEVGLSESPRRINQMLDNRMTTCNVARIAHLGLCF